MREFTNEKFSTDIWKLYKYISRNFGREHEALEIIIAWFDTDNFEDSMGDDKSKWFKYDESGMFELLYCLVNWDFITITERGTIDRKKSNHLEIVKILSPYVEKETALKIRKHFEY